MSDVRLFLAGDVMTGRGIDQALATPSEPTLHEVFVEDAREYVLLAEEVNGPIPRPVAPAHVWGAALEELERRAPDARIVNLETSVTRSGAWEAKGINYRMHPDNVGVLTAARVDVCALANNHVLDWGVDGLLETLETLRRARVVPVGAGRDQAEASRPAAVDLGGGRRVLVLALGAESSGIPRGWAAGPGRPGVHLARDLSGATARRLGALLEAARRPGDVVVASVHWGPNWGYEVPAAHRRFARALVEAGVDVVHGHSSHHPLGVEVHQGRLILYGCGDFIDDYEGIAGHAAYRPDLRLMFFPRLDAESGRLERLDLVPLRAERFSLVRASRDDAVWLTETLGREGRPLGTRVVLAPDGALTLAWG